MPTVNVTVSPTTNVVTAQLLSGTAAIDAAAAIAIQARDMAQHFAEIAEEAASGGGGGGGGGSSTIAGLTDVQISSPLNLNLFYYNAAASKWENSSFAALGLATTAALDLKLNASSVVNSLTSVSTTTPLSAAQGKVLKDLLDALGIANVAGLSAALAAKAPLNSPTFTGSVSGISKSMVGLGNIDNTTDASKPVSTAQQSALDAKIAISAIVNSLTSTSTTTPLSAAMGKSLKDQLDAAIIDGGGGATTFSALTDTEFSDLADNDLAVYDTATSKWVNASISELGGETSAGAQAKVDTLESSINTALAAKAPTANPTFTGTVTGPTFVGALTGNAATATALATARTINGVSFSGTANITLTANTPNALTLSSAGGGAASGTTFNGGAAITISYDSIGAIPQSAIVNNLTSTSTTAPLSAAQGKALKDLIDAINALLASDETTLDSIQEVVDYIMANRATLESLGIANVSGLSAALADKAPLASPTFTGTVGGITKSMVGLSNVDNTADTAKPVSTAQQTALNLKANAANPVLTGSITEQVHTMAGTVLEPDNGTVQEKTLSAPATLTDGLATGQSLVLHLLNGATHAVTWPTITWVSGAGNVAPTLTANDTLVFWKIGSTLYGAHSGNSV